MNHRTIDLSRLRRVLAATDVHGQYAELDARLADVGYDPEVDGLVLCGDLCDRGPDSPAFERAVARPNVHRTLGNHDTLPALYMEDGCDADDVRGCGGQWFLDLEEDERLRVARLLADAPMALTVRTPLGRSVGFVHADCSDDWDAFTALLDAPPSFARRQAHQSALSNRTTITELFAAVAPGGGGTPRPYSCHVSGIDHVFHGHTVVSRAIAHHDRTWFDTGAGFPHGRLTVLDVDRWLDVVDLHSPFG